MKVLWRQPLTTRGLGGVAATQQYVIVGDRALNDTADVYRCFDARTGEELWSVSTLALGQLDYGNSSRATPLIHGGRVYLFGAFGDLVCADLATGDVQWRVNVRDDYEVTEPLPWGFCGSPLIDEERLILSPGGEFGSIIALNPIDGEEVWATTGQPPGYGSFIVADIGGARQIIGHDAVSLGGWDPKSGERLWTLTPPQPNDFNVPTPIVDRDTLIVATENNGTRMYRFNDDGRIDPTPEATFADLVPDTQTPIVVGRRLFGASGALYCLDLDNGLQPIWIGKDEALHQHASLVADENRLLAWTESGELLLIDATADEFTVLDRRTLFPGENGLLSHPAIVGHTLYIRGTNEIQALSLEP